MSGCVVKTFREKNALLKGHFILSSGLHTEYFFQKSLIYQDCSATSLLASKVADIVEVHAFDHIVSVAVGGLILGYEVAKNLNSSFIFLERDRDKKLSLRRTFKYKQNDSCVLVDDILTTGSTVKEAYQSLTSYGFSVVHIACLLDRSQSPISFPSSYSYVERSSYPLYTINSLPNNISSIKPTVFSSRSI